MNVKTDSKKPKKEESKPKDKDDGILGTGLAEKTRRTLKDRGNYIESQLRDALK